MRTQSLLLLIILPTLLSFTGINALADETTTLLVRANLNFRPFYFKTENGPWEGLEVEVAQTVAAEAGVKLTFVIYPWRRSLDYMKKGKLDIMLALSKTEERAEYIDYFAITRYEQNVLVVRKENLSLEIKSVNDFTRFNKKIGIIHGYYYPSLSERLEWDKELKEFMSIVEHEIINVKMARKGRILGFLEDKISASYNIGINPDYEGLAMHPFTLTKPLPVWMGVSKKTNEKIRKRLKSAYIKLQKKGTIKAINDKWLKK